jgi:chromosome segregation ATPase
MGHPLFHEGEFVVSSFFDKLKDGASKAADKAHQTLEISRLNAQISSVKKDIDKAYSQIGQSVYIAYTNGDLSQAEAVITEYSSKILSYEQSIVEIEQKIKDVKRE